MRKANILLSSPTGEPQAKKADPQAGPSLGRKRPNGTRPSYATFRPGEVGHVTHASFPRSRETLMHRLRSNGVNCPYGADLAFLSEAEGLRTSMPN